jgi:PAS domain S-box-containing protein/diguanylate cyclase (GGDEF)-like protein
MEMRMDNEIGSCLSLEKEGEVTLTPLEYGHIFDIQHEILELMATGDNGKFALERLCQMAEAMLPNSVASVMWLNISTGLMEVLVAPSVPQAGHDVLNGLKPGPGGGSCANALFHNEAQYVKDAKTDKRWVDIHQIAYDFNLCSCWSMPIRDEANQAIGTFALSSFEHRSPSGFHKRLLEVCAYIVNIILKRVEYETLLKKKQDELNIFGTVFEHAPNGIIVTDSHNKIIQVNNGFTNIFGYGADEVLGHTPSMFASGRHDQSFYEQMWGAIVQDRHWSGEIWNKRANGETFPEWLSISAIADYNDVIQNYLAIFTDLSELRQSQESALRYAYYDQSTGLPNRQKLKIDMNERYPGACAIFNIARFREINDLFGVEAADHLLEQVAGILMGFDLQVYRIGGDEFVVLFYDEVTRESLTKRIDQLLELLRISVFTIADEAVAIRMNVGIAIGSNKLLTHADIALHLAKDQKISYAFYEENANVEQVYRTNIAMTTAIHKALSEDRIICHYQPIVDFVTGKIVKYETLVRMLGENGEIIPPVQFLPVAKKTKLYPHITHAVLRQACHCFAGRSEEFSINLSIDDIEDAETVQYIINTILATNTASRIVFEILESEGIENYESVVRFITEVKALGAKIAIDDFGTGYSNFEHVLKLDVDYIKIDGSLIRRVVEDSRHRIIVETIVDFAHKIGATTIAEFVSDEAIFLSLKSIGVDFSQGYFTGKPQALSALN